MITRMTIIAKKIIKSTVRAIVATESEENMFTSLTRSCVCIIAGKFGRELNLVICLGNRQKFLLAIHIMAMLYQI